MRQSIIVSLASLLFVTFVFTASAGIKERFAQRLPLINKMKAQGIIGEDNQGLLAPRGKLTPAQTKIINEENADRKKVYAMLARKNKIDAVTVGKLRAKQIAKKSKKGIYLQKADGSWYKK